MGDLGDIGNNKGSYAPDVGDVGSAVNQKYHPYFNGYTGKSRLLATNATVDDTLKHLKRIALRDSYQVKKLSKMLAGESVKQTAKNIWDFIRENLTYKLDEIKDENGRVKRVEALRTPANTLYTGIFDCDDATILTSAVLINLGIPHEYRITAYTKKGKFDHIYPVAIDEMGNEYVIDAVPEIPHFNYEELPIIDLKTIKMELYELSGLGDLGDLGELGNVNDLNDVVELEDFDNDLHLNEEDFDLFTEHQLLNGLIEVEKPEDADVTLKGSQLPALLKNGVRSEVNKARNLLLKEVQAPTALSDTINVEKELKILNAVFNAWEDSERTAQILSLAIEHQSPYTNFYKSILLSLRTLEEDQENQLGDLGDLGNIYLKRVPNEEIDLFEMAQNGDLGFLKKWRRKGRNLWSRIRKVTRKAVKAVVRYNPVTLALRGATLAILKLNLFGFSEKLYYGYISKDHARRNNMNMQWHAGVQRSLKRLVNFYVKVGGKPTAFKNAVVNGRAKKKVSIGLGDVGQLGAEPVSTATIATAGAAFITLATSLLKKFGMKKAFNDKKAGQESNSNRTMRPPAIVRNKDAYMPNVTVEELPEEKALQRSPNNQKNSEKPSFWDLNKRYIIPIAAVAVIAGVWLYKRSQKKKARQLAGIKAARTRKRNQKMLAAAPTRRKTATRSTRKKTTTRSAAKTSQKSDLKGSTTIIKVPAKNSAKNVRVTKRSNKQRLKAMHAKAKQLQRKHPKTKYSSLLKRAAAMI